MTDADARILHILRGCRGPSRALTAGAIGELVFGRRGCDRQVRDSIKHLIEIEGHGEIVANTGGEAFAGQPAGYFWATDPVQIAAYYEVLVSRKEEIDHRMEAAWQAKRRLESGGPLQPSLALE